MTSIFKRILGESDDQQKDSLVVASEQPAIEPIEVTDDNFEELVLKADRPVLVDLWAEWCAPCHMVAPTVKSLAVEYEGRAIVAKLNVDENPRTPGRYGIMGIPTLLFFKGGKEADRHVGVGSYPQLARKMEKLLD